MQPPSQVLYFRLPSAPPRRAYHVRVTVRALPRPEVFGYTVYRLAKRQPHSGSQNGEP